MKPVTAACAWQTNALIFEKSLSPMVMINTSGIVLQYNECAVQAFGYSKEEVRADTMMKTSGLL